MFRYHLRTLLILTILGPPVLAGMWFNWDFTLRALVVAATLILIPVATVSAGLAIAIPAVAAVELVKALIRKTKSSE